MAPLDREHNIMEFTPQQFPLPLSYTIRQARREDVPKLEWYGSHAHTRHFIRHAYKEMLRGRRVMLVADLNGFPVGQAYVQFDSKTKYCADGVSRGYIYAFRVITHLQSLGIGSRLLKAAEQVLIDRGFSIATLQVSKRNERARRLYQQHGYRVFREDPGQWSYVDQHGRQRSVNDPCWVMEKRLAR